MAWRCVIFSDRLCMQLQRPRGHPAKTAFAALCCCAPLQMRSFAIESERMGMTEEAMDDMLEDAVSALPLSHVLARLVHVPCPFPVSWSFLSPVSHPSLCPCAPSVPVSLCPCVPVSLCPLCPCVPVFPLCCPSLQFAGDSEEEEEVMASVLGELGLELSAKMVRVVQGGRGLLSAPHVTGVGVVWEYAWWPSFPVKSCLPHTTSASVRG
jgi:hypothetical protein